MSLADRCIHDFDSGVRSRGEQYYLLGRVSMRSRGSSEYRASVQGESEYKVVLDWGFSREQLSVCCTCPYYDEHAICKHIWATILAADAANAGPRGKGRLGILPMDPEDYEADDDDSWIDVYDEDDDDDDVNPPIVPRGKAGSRREPPPKPRWQQQLTWAQPEVEPANPVRAIATPRAKMREIWYVLVEGIGIEAGKPVLLLLQRESKTNGQFGKLKQLNIRPYEVSRLVGPEDAEILNLLLGYHDVESQPSYYSYSSVARLGGRIAQDHAAVPPAQACGHATAGKGGE